MKLKFSNL